MINQSYAMDEKRTKKFGQLLNTIDFELDVPAAKETLERLKADTTIGTFHIGGTEFKMTFAEINHVMDTLQQAKVIFNQKYRLGMYGS